MPVFRCPAHDTIFEASSDTRKPGAPKTDKLPAHPTFKGKSGHPDCPQCQKDKDKADKPDSGKKGDEVEHSKEPDKKEPDTGHKPGQQPGQHPGQPSEPGKKEPEPEPASHKGLKSVFSSSKDR